jgi:hypothetical protein
MGNGLFVFGTAAPPKRGALVKLQGQTRGPADSKGLLRDCNFIVHHRRGQLFDIDGDAGRAEGWAASKTGSPAGCHQRAALTGNLNEQAARLATFYRGTRTPPLATTREQR